MAGTNAGWKRFAIMTDDEFAKLEEPIALVVDDEPLIRMDTANMVADQGFAIVEARTVDEAFAFLKKHPSLQLLFTDVQTATRPHGWVRAGAKGRRKLAPYLRGRGLGSRQAWQGRSAR